MDPSTPIHDPININLEKQTQELLSHIGLESDYAQTLLHSASPTHLLSNLSHLLSIPSLTLAVAKAFRPLLIDLCARWLTDEENLEDRFVALCLLIEPHQELFPILSAFCRRPSFSEGPFGFVSSCESIVVLNKTRLHRLLLSYYRLLQANRLLPHHLLWPVSCLSTLFWSPYPDTGVQLLAIRCYALQCGMAEVERERLESRILGDFCGVDCLIHYGQNTDGSAVQIDGWLFPVLEIDRITKARNALVLDDQDFYASERDSSVPRLSQSDLCPLVANICGVFMLKASSCSAPSSTMISTPSAIKYLRAIAIQLSLRVPTLVSSSPSSGKSTLLSYLASTLYPDDRDHIIPVNLADTSLDPRSLLGSYVSSPTQPGTFEWKDGVLVRAMREGKWLVLEDIDRGSSEVLGLIKPLAESLALGNWIGVRASIDVPNRGRVEAAESFALFATRSVAPLITGNIPTASFFGAHKFHEIIVDSPSEEEVRMIIDARFPRLAGVVASAVIQLWRSIHSLGSTSSTRDVGLRELEQFCKRIDNLLPAYYRHITTDAAGASAVNTVSFSLLFPNPSLREELFLEARDVFFGAGTLTATARTYAERVSALVAESLGLDAERHRWLLDGRTPEYDVEKDSNGDIVSVRIGRTRLTARSSASIVVPLISRPFAMHKPAICLLSRIATSVSLCEPILLTGETGTGKTSVVTHLASLLHRPLISLNLSHQTESSDLLGGFKPIDARIPGSELQERFLTLFGETFSRRKNAKFEESVRRAVKEGKWKRAVALWREAIRLAKDRIQAKAVDDNQEPESMNLDQDIPRKRRKTGHTSLQESEAAWDNFQRTVDEFDIQHAQGTGKFAFDFVEGPLVKALRSGDWILLDEINLASPETLECITGLLRGPASSIILTEQGTLEAVPRHPDFRLFACMNPATDVGKKDLPPNIRARFTEIDVPSPDADRETLLTIITQYIGSSAVGDKAAIMNVAEFYMAVKDLAEKRQLADGSNHRPHYSMRTLARALTFAAEIAPMYSLRRALWEGCLMAFTMVLDPPSAELVTTLAQKHILAGVKNPRSLLARDPTLPASRSQGDFVKFGPFFLERGPLPEDPVEQYVMTPSVETKLIDLSRIILTRRFPVLIEGPTSSGKTSAVEYLAKRTGHRFIRINNHEHTDVQEYLGSYVSDPVTGKLVFKDGLLVHALRHGHWIVLDELNLAPTDVLEALNRLLDDNRELVVPETQEVIRPHPHFMLFATQNPPGLYAGRKILSRAFRNRFLEVHFQDVPQTELETILCQRCRIAPSYGQRIVSVFQELQKRRQAGRVFESKQSFATLRDLFRWAGRDAVGYQELAENGYMLLAERARREDDKLVVKEVIESVMKVRIDEKRMYNIHDDTPRFLSFLECPIPASQIVWTTAMQRLFVLVARALRFNEPVLLVGETGSGKTSVCQVFAEAVSRHLHAVNCHQNTETADLIGGLRPVRNRTASDQSILLEASMILRDAGVVVIPADTQALSVCVSNLLASEIDSSLLAPLHDIQNKLRSSAALFDWYDGPLVKAMNDGDVFLLDEISLADDSVLERLNSVLEPERSIVLAERGGADVDHQMIYASNGFQFLATMNPGGDYGKKELSPALRNRFTEIWVPSVDARSDLRLIVDASWTREELRMYTDALLDFVDWLRERVGDHSICSLRDILAWINFSNAVSMESRIPTNEIFHHAAHMTFLDGLGALHQIATYSLEAISRIKADALWKLQELVPFTKDDSPSAKYDPCRYVQFGSFAIPKGTKETRIHKFNLEAPTTRDNAMRVARACQVPKPILLEGSPGVGKTGLITALANVAGHHLCRINLSDQTDLVDLFGSDLPVENGAAGEFSWRDAEFLKAVQEGHWVLLDEMNLAPQAILEGLNAILDHRGTVYIPELGRSFVRHPSFRVFAAQNPVHQGGGRKGLPKSFLDRFTKCYVNELTADDLLLVCQNLFEDTDTDILRAMIAFNARLNHETVMKRSFANEGSPWEFNLRDIIRWGDLLRATAPSVRPVDHLRTIYLSRFRTIADRDCAQTLFDNIFSTSSSSSQTIPYPLICASSLRIGHFQSARNNLMSPLRPRRILQSHLASLEAIGLCVVQSWLVIITGRHDTGKTDLIRVIANLTGNELHEISVNSASDTTDILGSFEQSYIRGHVVSLAQKILTLAQQYMRSAPKSSSPYTEYRALSNLVSSPRISSLSVILQAASRMLLEIRSTVATEDELPQIESLEAELTDLLSQKSVAGRFEWVDGPLVRAIKQGYWVVLDGANLCNPSVLDRLNSLCEADGVLTLNERGYVDGQVQVLKPHPDFRLFMTVDPHHGELSRAMRNRGVEIALLSNPTEEDECRLRDHLRLPDMTPNYFHSASSAFEAIRRGLQKSDSRTAGNIMYQLSTSTIDQDHSSSALLAYSHFFKPPRRTNTTPLLRFLARSAIFEEISVWLRLLEHLEPTNDNEISPVRAILVDLRSSDIFSAINFFRISNNSRMENYEKALPLDQFLVCSPCAECAAENVCHPNHLALLQALRLFSDVSSLKTDKVEAPAGLVGMGYDSGIFSSLPLGLNQETHQRAINALHTVLEECASVAINVLRRLGNGASSDEIVSAALLLNYRRYIRKSTSDSAFNHSLVQVVSNWISEALDRGNQAFNKLVTASDELQRSISLTTGLGMTEIWTNVLAPESMVPYQELRELEKSARQISRTYENRRQIIHAMALGTIPTVSTENDHKNVLTLIEKTRRSVHSNYNRSIPQGSDPCSLLIELNLLSQLHDASTAIGMMTQLLDATYQDSCGDLLRFVPYQHAVWSGELEQIPLSIVVQLHSGWLHAIWNELEADVNNDGPACLLHPMHLATTYQKSQWKGISLASLGDYDVSLHRHLRFTTMQSSIFMSRPEQLYAFLSRCILMISACFSNSFNNTILPQLQLTKSPNDLHSLVSLLDHTTHEPFQSALRRWLIPATQHSSDSSSSQKYHLITLGRCWIALSRLILELFIPNVPVDPATILRCSADFWRSEEESVRDELLLHLDLEKRTAGNSSNSVTRYLDSVLHDIQTRSLQYSTPVPHRPDIARLQSFWAETHQFLDQVICPSKIDPLLNILALGDLTASKREEVLQESISGFCQRLAAIYPDFEDITKIIQLSLLQFRLGLRLVRCGSTSDVANSDSPNYIATALVAFPSIRSARDITKDLNVDTTRTLLPFDRLLLQVTAAGLLCCFRGVSAHMSEISSAYEQAFRLWSMDRKREGEKEQEMNSLYRRRTLDHDATTESEVEEAEFLELFPTFEEVLERPDTRDTNVTAHGSAFANSPQIQQLVSLHLSIFGEQRPESQPNMKNTFRGVRETVLKTIVETHFVSLHDSLDTNSLHVQLTLLHSKFSILKGTGTLTGASSNFYSDPNVAEAQKMMSIIVALKSRLSNIVEEWPDQMVLHHLLERCDSILALDFSSPVAKFLSAVEQLLVQTDDWEMYANRDNTLKEHRHAITTLIINWRRLELSCWKQLLQSQYESFASGVSDFWFNLYDLTIRGPLIAVEEEARGENGALSRYLGQLPSLLDDFLRSGNIGQFDSRMSLLRSFERLVDSLSKRKSHEPKSALRRVHVILHSTWRYYQLFAPQLAASLAEQRGSLEKELQGLIKLASWKDVNVHALKESARRTHHNLYKLIRKFRDVMRQPAVDKMSPVFAGDAESVYTEKKVSLKEGSSFDMDLPPAGLLADSSTHSHLANLPLTFKRFGNLLDNRVRRFLGQHSAHSVDELAVEVIVTSKRLANQPIPANLSKEKRAKFNKALLSRKRKAWSDLLKELKRGGLATNVKPEVLQQIRDERWIREQPLMPSSTDAAAVDKGENYFDRIRGALPPLRGLLGDHHSDVTTRDLLRGVSFVESGLFLALGGRSQLAHNLESYSSLHRLTQRLRILCEASQLAPLDTSGCGQLERLNLAMANILHGLEELSQSVSIFYELQDPPVVTASLQDQIHSLCGSTRILCDRAHTVICDAEPFPVTMLHDEYIVIIDAVAHIHALPGILEEMMAREPQLSYILRPTETWIREQEFSVLTLIDTAQEQGDHSNQEIDLIIDSLLVTVQSLLKHCPEENSTGLSLSPSPSSDEPEDNYIRNGFCVVSELLQSLGIDAFLDKLVPALTSQSRNPHGFQNGLRRLLPFVHRYMAFAEETLAELSAWTKALFKLDFVLCSVVHTIAKQGFCVPPDVDEDGGEGGEEGQSTGGVGLGEGVGTENVSKEIEDESQVEGLRGDTNDDQDQQQRGPEDNDKDNTIEMSEDFGGALEDVPDDGDEEKGSDDDDEGEDDGEGPEEQLGELDKGDPNKVDEKLWGDENTGDDERNDQDEVPEERSNEKEQEKQSDVVAKEQGKRSKTKEKQTQNEGESQEENNEDQAAGAPDADDAQGKGDEGNEDEIDDEPPNASGAQMDEHIPDADTLDLPDDMALDKFDADKDKQDDDSLDMESEVNGDDNVDDDRNEQGGDGSDDDDDSMDVEPEQTQAQAGKPDGIDEDFPEGEQTPDQPPHVADDEENHDKESKDGDDDDSNPVAQPDTSAGNEHATADQQQADDSPVTSNNQAGGSGAQKHDAGVEDVDAVQDQDMTADESNVNNSTRSQPPPPSAPQAPGTSNDGTHRGTANSSHRALDLSTNPLRNLGDALKEVHARFDEILNNERSADSTPLLPPAEQAQQVEYADGDEDGEDGVMQALGPAGADEEQVTKLSDLKLVEDAPHQDVDMDMDVDMAPEANPSLPTPSAMHAEPTADALRSDGDGALTQTDVQNSLRAVHGLPPTDGPVPTGASAEDEPDDDPMDMDAPDLDAAAQAALLSFQRGAEHPSEAATSLWHLYTTLTAPLAAQLSAQLRLILAPTLATRLRGDYRTGKRLNMKKLVGYLASDCTKDKIWLRRTRPSARAYQVLVALDDSRSMWEGVGTGRGGEGGGRTIHLAYAALALVLNALGKLEVGDVAVARFGSTVEMVKDFSDGSSSTTSSITTLDGARIMGAFKFDQRATDVLGLVQHTLGVLERARERSAQNQGELWQLEIIISDGICQDHERLGAVLRRAREKRVMIVFIIVDSLHSGTGGTGVGAGAGTGGTSILSLNRVAYKPVTTVGTPTFTAAPRTELQMEPYLASFPFEYYVVLRDVEALPDVLAGTLRQFFERVGEE
ncbi:midasin [Hygrophoropsis aurantiaca]|uniref:Midasin n=1 Tax=Hygrophoropsis aurantiaca TaxID=72124 RepID=A0ACB8A2Z2_9AGAM|nr:midasin [Hygrophoropsis aurantiaca]